MGWENYADRAKFNAHRGNPLRHERERIGKFRRWILCLLTIITVLAVSLAIAVVSLLISLVTGDAAVTSVLHWIVGILSGGTLAALALIVLTLAIERVSQDDEGCREDGTP